MMATSISMMTSSIGDFVVGIEAARIGAVLDVTEVKDREDLLDIASVWGIPPPGDEGRRVLQIKTASDKTYQVLVGETLQLQTIEPREFCRLPILIEETARDAGIASFFIVESDFAGPGRNRLGLVVDVEWLSEHK